MQWLATSGTDQGPCGAPLQDEQTAWDIRIDGVEVAGTEAVWVAEDGWIGLGPEDVGPLDTVAVVGLWVEEPEDNTIGGCEMNLIGATISTSRRAQGTAEQVDARRYDFAHPADVGITYVGQSAIRGRANFPIQRVIILPNGSTDYSETVSVELRFVAHEP